MVLQGDFPPDIRVEKEARTLIAAGHEVHLVCRNKKMQETGATVEGLKVHRLPLFTKHARFNNLVSTPLFFNPVWFARLRKIVKQYQIQVIHVHDLPLVPLGLFVAKLHKIPIIYDMHENYPAALEVWRQKGLVWLTIRNPKFAARLDRFCQKRVDQIIVVVEEQRENLVQQGIPARKIQVISNTVDLSQINDMPIDKKVKERYRDNFMLIYVGGFSRDRDLGIPIRAMKTLRKTIPFTKLVLVGGGDDLYTAELKKLVNQHNLTEVVEFINWVPFKQIASYLKAGSVGIVPQPANLFINTTVPHKLFQYMALGLPVLVSDAKPLARIVREGQCGEIFRSGDAEDFARTILRIQQADIPYGENGKRLVQSKYNWKNTSKKLQALYQQFEMEEKC